MEETTTKYTCEKCGKERTEAEGSFLDEQQKKFCCEDCCKKDGDKKPVGICEFC